LAALFAASKLGVKNCAPPPEETALGALLKHITSSPAEPFCPSNIHFGLFPPPDQTEYNRKHGKKRKKEVLCLRALNLLNNWKKK
jgi:methylenetetrahydrofolate--tRNA-(uracil-5-)-methyltransferase